MFYFRDRDKILKRYVNLSIYQLSVCLNNRMLIRGELKKIMSNHEIRVSKPKFMKNVKITTKDGLQYRPLDNSFLNYFEYVNRTGNTFPYITKPRICIKQVRGKAELNKHKYGLLQVELKDPCPECGSMIDIRDEIRGEIVCPNCGWVRGQMIV